MHFIKEKWQHIRWIASKLASNVFADKVKSEVKQDLNMLISWGEPNVKEIKTVMDQVSSTPIKELPGDVGDNKVSS